MRRYNLVFFQSAINTEIESLPVNEALLQLVGNPVPNNASANYQKLLPPEDLPHYLIAKRCIEELALYLKPCQATPNSTSGNLYFLFLLYNKLYTAQVYLNS